MNRKLAFNQITLITDGLSNQGLSPLEAAKRAYKNNIVVNVIGIIEKDNHSIGIKGQEEIENIAMAGGGLSQIVPIEKVAKTVQMVTRTALTNTIQQVVQAQLKEILGKKDILEIAPMERAKVAGMIDSISEKSELHVLLLIDQSASMVTKMEKVKEAIIDFQLNLRSRTGKSLLSIITFPGKLDVTNIGIPWTEELGRIDHLLYNMEAKGNTPTGPAIMAGIAQFSKIDKSVEYGVLDEYII